MSSKADRDRVSRFKGMKPISRQLSLYLFGTLLATGIITSVLLSVIVLRGFSLIYQQELDQHVGEVDACIDLYLDDRLAVLNDMASAPLLKQAVMQPEFLLEDVSDFMGRMRLLGREQRISLLDFEGRVVSGYLGPDIILEELMDELTGRRGVPFTRLCLVEEEPFVFLSTAIFSHNLVEGALVAQIPLADLLRELYLGEVYKAVSLEVIQDQIVVGSLGEVVQSSHSGQRYSEWLDAQLVLRSDKSAMLKLWMVGLWVMGGIIMVMVLLFTLVAYRLSQRNLLAPVSQLQLEIQMAGEKGIYCSQRGFSTSILELSQLREGFQQMMQRVETREQKLVQVQEELRSAHRRLQIWDEAKRQWLGNLGHELRTPLTGLFSLCDALFEGHISEKELRELEGEYRTTRHQLEKLLDDASLLTYLDVSAEDFWLEPMPLGVALAGTIDELSVLSVDFVCDESLEIIQGVTVEAEPALLQRAFTDILRTLTHCIGNAGCIRLSGWVSDDKVRICACAQQASLSHREVALFFEVGGQGDSFKAGKEFGLGARLAARIVQIFGGEIKVKSENNEIIIDIIFLRS
jgi:signal transduction histidine kinase